MNKFLVERFKVALSLTPWWWRVAYLIIPDPSWFQTVQLEGFQEIALGKDKAFNSLIETHVSAFLEKGTMPPAQISGAILNIAEDLVAGRTPTLRAGDYIALNSYKRAAK